MVFLVFCLHYFWGSYTQLCLRRFTPSYTKKSIFPLFRTMIMTGKPRGTRRSFPFFDRTSFEWVTPWVGARRECNPPTTHPKFTIFTFLLSYSYSSEYAESNAVFSFLIALFLEKRRLCLLPPSFPLFGVKISVFLVLHTMSVSVETWGICWYFYFLDRTSFEWEPHRFVFVPAPQTHRGGAQ